MEGATEASTLKLTTSGSLALLAVVQALLKGHLPTLKVVFSADVSLILIAISSFLTSDIDLFNKKSEEIFNFISTLEGFTADAF